MISLIIDNYIRLDYVCNIRWILKPFIRLVVISIFLFILNRNGISKFLNKANNYTLFRFQVAIKRLKENFHSWSECVTLRELETLRSVSNHENIVDIKELIREENSQLHFVFEYMPDGNLFQVTKENLTSPHPRVKLTTEKVHSIIRQVLGGLEHIHSRGYFHRDIKPENLLMRGETCKIADFGLARRHRCNSNTPPLTEYISTRWYRAPEVLLCSPDYGSPIDIFAVGLVMVELLALRPLFPGTSDLDQIFRIFNVLGRPKEDNWAEGMRLMQKMMSRLPSDDVSTLQEKRNLTQIPFKHVPFHMVKSKHHFEQIMPQANATTVSFVYHLLRLDPTERPTAGESLTADCFQLHSPIINTEEDQEKIIFQNSSRLQHAAPMMMFNTRNTTPLLVIEAPSMGRTPSQKPHRSITAHQPIMQGEGIKISSKQRNPLLETRKISRKLNHTEQMPFTPTSYDKSIITHDHFTNFQHVRHEKESTVIKPTLMKRVNQLRRNCQDEKSNRCSGFGVAKFR